MGLWDSKKEWEEYLGPFFWNVENWWFTFDESFIGFFKMKLPGFIGGFSGSLVDFF